MEVSIINVLMQNWCSVHTSCSCFLLQVNWYLEIGKIAISYSFFGCLNTNCFKTIYCIVQPNFCSKFLFNFCSVEQQRIFWFLPTLGCMMAQNCRKMRPVKIFSELSSLFCSKSTRISQWFSCSSVTLSLCILRSHCLMVDLIGWNCFDCEKLWSFGYSSSLFSKSTSWIFSSRSRSAAFNQ